MSKRTLFGYSLISFVTTYGVIGTAWSQAPASFDPNYELPRTSYGHPDFQGVWSNAILTPLERPAEFADQAFLTEEQANTYLGERRQDTFRGDRTVDAETDVTHAYNNFWWDWGTELARTRRTSLIIDPPDGRLPALTPEAQ